MLSAILSRAASPWLRARCVRAILARGLEDVFLDARAQAVDLLLQVGAVRRGTPGGRLFGGPLQGGQLGQAVGLVLGKRRVGGRGVLGHGDVDALAHLEHALTQGRRRVGDARGLRGAQQLGVRGVGFDQLAELEQLAIDVGGYQGRDRGVHPIDVAEHRGVQRLERASEAIERLARRIGRDEPVLGQAVRA
ncbi:MAG: hypothetical protein ACI9U2_001637 [Bradymonadia bacterium]|jgi:hypothetical protein